MNYAYRNPYQDLPRSIENPTIAKAGFTEQSAALGAVHLNYIVGPNNGPALVLIPAQTGTWESYQHVLVPLSKHFQVYAVDIRGHGKSTWTPGDYTWESVGEDMRAFLKNIVKRPAIIAGNSSGGIIALWCAARIPEQTAAIVLEDAPVFSVEMPRFKEQDRFVYNGLVHTVESLGDIEHRDLANYLKGQVLPVSETRTKRVPDWFIRVLSRLIRQEIAAHPDRPPSLKHWYLPRTLGLLIKSISMFDPDFARAFVDGRMYKGLDHAEALKQVKCPVLVLHANWHRYPRYGLVGAMDDQDAARIKQLAPQTQYQKIPANHVIHAFKPKEYVKAVKAFARGISST